MANQDYVCPKPKRWNEIFNDLCKGYGKTADKIFPTDVVGIRKAGGPPIPHTFNGWVCTTDEEKHLRWIETMEWAVEHDLSGLIDVEEKDKCYFVGHNHREDSRWGYNDYTEKILSEYELNEFVTLNEYLESPSAVRNKLPNRKGIYFVIYPHQWPEYSFLEEGTGSHYRGKNPNIPITNHDELDNFEDSSAFAAWFAVETLWKNWVDDADILYIGQTGGTYKNGRISKGTLRKRIETLFKFGKGQKVAHWGGRYLWQHDESHDFRVYWYECKDNENPIELERKLLNEFKDEYGKNPFANIG